MAKKSEEDTRKKVARMLPLIADKAVRNYQDMINLGASKFNEKSHPKVYYEVCKAAAAHLQMLLKLAEWAEVPADKIGTTPDDIKLMLQESQVREAERIAVFDGDDGEVV